MSLLDKIIYVADYIEPGRVFPGVKDARELALIDLDEAVAFETKHTLAHLHCARTTDLSQNNRNI